MAHEDTNNANPNRGGKSTAVTHKTPASFEDALRELDAITQSMEAGELPLQASLQAYQRGAFLVKYCQAQLAAVQAQIKLVEGDVLRPFDLQEGTS